MSSAVCNYGSSQINFFMPSTPGVAWPEPAERSAAPKNAKAGPQILTFALHKRPRATRASVPKVRTGCIDCKRRHVKCDEAKPSCQRCVKWQGFCKGYDTPSGGSSSSTPTPDNDRRSTTPVTKVMEKTGLSNEPESSSQSSKAELLLEPTENLFKDESERLYYDHWFAYRHRLGGGFFDERLWSETIPQLSRQHASVRYAIMAIGGIGKAIPCLKPTNPAQMGANGPHYGLALSYYGRAIREVRETIREAKLDTSSLRGAIVCCLLFVCFEVMHDDRKAAFSHIINGQKMMDELVRRRCEEADAQGQSVLGADSLETDTLHVFQRLIQQAWSCGVLRRRDQNLPESPGNVQDLASERSWCCRGGSAKKCAIHNMPSSFETLQEARRWWDVTQHFVTHSSNIVFRVSYLGLDDEFLSECKERIQRHTDDIERARAGEEPATPEQWHAFQDALKRWHDAFDSLWTVAQKARYEDERSYAQAAHLRAHYLTVYGCVHAPLSCSHDSIAQLTPKYREVVELCRGLVERQKRDFDMPEVFTMDMGPTWPLFMAGTRCRDADVRNEAIRLLHDNPRRDGLWDSRIFYALTIRNRILEISNAQDGTIEEQWWRLQHRSAYIDEQGRLIARVMDKNQSTGTWDFGEDNLRRFLCD